MDEKPAPDEMIDRALHAQDLEYASDFESTNQPLQSIVEEIEPSTLLAVGAELLADVDPRRRVLGTRILRELWDNRPAALKWVLEAIPREQDADALVWLLSAVGFIGDSSGLALVEQYADHPDPRVRDRAATAISRCGIGGKDPSGLAALIQLSDDDDDDVRFSAVYELAEWWLDGCREALIEDRLDRVVDDRDNRVRRAATEALATRG